MLAAFLTTICFSVSAISGHRCAKALGGLEANFWRLAIAAVLLGCYSILGGGHLFGAAFGAFALSGLVGVGCGDMAFFQALPRLGSRLTVLLIQCLSVPIAALAEWLWLGTKLTGPQALCGVLILAGIWMALAPPKDTHALLPGKKSTGIIFAVLAAAGNGLGAVLSRNAYRISRAAGEDLDGPTAALDRIMGGLFIAALVVLIVRWRQVQWRLRPAELGNALEQKWRPIWPWVLTTSLAGQTLGVSCFQWALKSYPTGVILPIVALTPLVTIPLSWAIEQERPCLRSLSGGIVAVSGVIALLSLK